MSQHYDVVIIGAGMAGASLGAMLVETTKASPGAHAGTMRVLLLEAEEHPGYHATGRSAAFWTESYGGPGIVPLTQASGPELASLGVLTRRGALTIARREQEPQLDRFLACYKELGVDIARLDRAALVALIPGLHPDWQTGALEKSCCDIDVARLHQHYLSQARAGGAEIRCATPMLAAKWQRGVAASHGGRHWNVTLADGKNVSCDILVNAAGAWADDVAQSVGAQGLGIIPYRRTIVQLRVSPMPSDDLPLVLDVGGSFYFKPQGDRLWLSPHDESMSPACDAAPEEIDVATAIARLEAATDWRVERVEHRWAGLRSFTPDRLPAYGFDPQVPGLFWFAGQGGFGIQTAPAAARLAAALISGQGELSVDHETYSPRRFFA